MILAIDPGRDKCGLAVMADRERVLEKKIVARPALSAEVGRLAARYQIATIVIGEGAFGRAAAKELPTGVKTTFVPEKNTTWLARRRYWRENPPRGLWRFIPTSLRVPPAPVDDLAAILIGERFFSS